MNIIDYGKMKNNRRIVCKNPSCGCVFDCCRVDSNVNVHYISHWLAFEPTSNHYKIMITCPMCDRIQEFEMETEDDVTDFFSYDD